MHKSYVVDVYMQHDFYVNVELYAFKKKTTCSDEQQTENGTVQQNV